MALTKVTTGVLADDSVTAALIADDAVGSAAIADDAVDADKLAGAINTLISNNELKIKRSKPLPDSVNTLDNCMNLKYI